jgi:two-component system C4-dicarboxylate transport response regulator DctD
MERTGIAGSATFADPVAPKITVLVIDEDANDLRSFSSFLEQEGFDVRACSTHADALHWLESEVLDFIIVSQGGPKFEGRSVVERAIEIDRRMSVLVLARHADIPCYIESMQLGALDYFEKPLAPQELLRLVKSHLRCCTGRDC